MALFVANNGQLQTVKGIYYGMTEDYINSTLFHNLVPKTATEIKFLYASDNPDLTGYQRIGYCDNNNFIEVWNSGTKYIIINPSKNYIYAPVNCNSFLDGYNNLTTCIFDNFDTQNVTSMSEMFLNCSSLTSLDLSSFKTDNVRYMYRTFRGCASLQTLNLLNFNYLKVTANYQLFWNCTNLVTINTTFNFNFRQMCYGLFYKCKKLKSVNFEKCIFSNTELQQMFYQCNALTEIIFPSNMPSGIYCQETFYQCGNLKSIYSPTWNNASGNNCFSQCNFIVGGAGTAYSSSHLNAEYARVDGENDLPGYFTAPTN